MSNIRRIKKIRAIINNIRSRKKLVRIGIRKKKKREREKEREKQ